MSTALTESSDADDTSVSRDVDAYLRAESIIDAINAALPEDTKQLPKTPKDYVFKRRDAADVALAFHTAFELSGGAPALWMWAMQNPDKFYPLFAKFANTELPNAGGTTFVFQAPIPQTPADLVSLTPTGQVVHLTADVEDLPE